MTTLTAPAQAPVPWRRLTWATWRQHRTALAAMGLMLTLTATVLLVTGIRMHADAANDGPLWLTRTPHYTQALLACSGLLQLLPLLGGAFLGAPLLAREAEAGTTRLAWTQGASRIRWLLARVVPPAVALGVAAAGLGLEFRWWLSPLHPGPSAWSGGRFYLNPLPLAGWVMLAFTLGVLLGGVIRRTLPAIAATLACYCAALYATTSFWRPFYLPPLHRADGAVTSSGGYGFYWISGRGPGPDILSTASGWPDGRLLSAADMSHPAAWYALNHIRLWTTYQPASRYGPFQLIEFGWLTALSVILVAATVAVIRRRPA